MTWTPPLPPAAAPGREARDGACGPVAALITSTTGIDAFGATRERSVDLVHKMMAALGCASYAALAARLREPAHGRELAALVDQLTVGETYFFREPGQLQFLRTTALPDVRRRCGAQHAVRAWSAGCASGEEAYTLAIILHEAGDAAAPVLGTDIAASAVAAAVRGTYRDWSFRAMSPELKVTYTSPTAGGMRTVVDALRQRVTFRQLNLVDAWSDEAAMRGFDIILCRNVLIYFAPEYLPALAQRFYAALAPGGWLVPGAADPLLHQAAPFEVVATPAGLVLRRPVGEPGEVEGAGCWRRGVDTAAGGGEGRCQSWLPSGPSILGGGDPAAPAWSGAATATSQDLAESTRLPSPAATQLEAAAAAATVLTRSGGGVSAAPPAAATPAEAALASAAAAHAQQAQDLYDQGDFLGAARQYAALSGEVWAEREVRALANADTTQAVARCRLHLQAYPEALSLLYLLALLLASGGDTAAAERALRSILYLDRAQPAALLALARLAKQRGDTRGARRLYELARQSLAGRMPASIVPLTDHDRVEDCMAAAAAALAALTTSC